MCKHEQATRGHVLVAGRVHCEQAVACPGPADALPHTQKRRVHRRCTVHEALTMRLFAVLACSSTPTLTATPPAGLA